MYTLPPCPIINKLLWEIPNTYHFTKSDYIFFLFYLGGFGSALMLKDLGLSQDAATRTNTSTPLGSLSLHMYRIMCNSGYAQKDFGSAFQFLQKK